jgi:hypothetical protein
VPSAVDSTPSPSHASIRPWEAGDRRTTHRESALTDRRAPADKRGVSMVAAPLSAEELILRTRGSLEPYPMMLGDWSDIGAYVPGDGSKCPLFGYLTKTPSRGSGGTPFRVLTGQNDGARGLKLYTERRRRSSWPAASRAILASVLPGRTVPQIQSPFGRPTTVTCSTPAHSGRQRISASKIRSSSSTEIVGMRNGRSSSVIGRAASTRSDPMR